MKRLDPLLLLVMMVLGLVSCQKEKSFESGGLPSAGSLQKNGTGDCLPKLVSGVYEKGKVLDGAINYIDVEIDVTRAGSYLIYSDTISGIFFRASGTFSTTGINTVRLKGNGTPTQDGLFNFFLTYTNNSCSVPVTISQAGASGQAAFTLAGAPDECMNYVLAGTYIAGQATSPSNTVTISVNVTALGTYSVSTTVSNGMTFSGTGTFVNLGAQTITLAATGTPVVAGNTNFPVSVGGSSCFFTVSVTATYDYFPRRAASNWSYEFDDTADDSLLVRAKTGTVTLGGSQYTVFEATDNASAGFSDFGNYRRAGSDYHTYADMGAYFGLDNAVNLDYIFLKDNVPVGNSWQTANINGTITDSSIVYPVSIRLVFRIEQKDVTVTVKGRAYTNVIVVSEKYQVFDGSVWQDVTALLGYFRSYYARDVGLIKQDYLYEDGNNNPPVNYKQDLRRYQIP